MEEKPMPRYDDPAHIDAAAIDPPRRTPEDYTLEYLKLHGTAARPSTQKDAPGAAARQDRP